MNIRVLSNPWWLALLALLAGPACADAEPADADADTDAQPAVESADPRCAALCSPHEPDVEGAFDVCSQESVGRCVELCELRIAGVANLCATCLLEDAWFSPGGSGEGGGEEGGSAGGSRQCEVSGREGECSHPCDDQEAYEDCLRQVYPRRTVECEPRFGPVEACAEICE